MTPEEQELALSFGRAVAAMTVVAKEVGGRRGIRGEVICPNCGGALRYRVASNGHKRAACDTADCCSFIE